MPIYTIPKRRQETRSARATKQTFSVLPIGEVDPPWRFEPFHVDVPAELKRPGWIYTTNGTLHLVEAKSLRTKIYDDQRPSELWAFFYDEANKTIFDDPILIPETLIETHIVDLQPEFEKMDEELYWDHMFHKYPIIKLGHNVMQCVGSLCSVRKHKGGKKTRRNKN